VEYSLVSFFSLVVFDFFVFSPTIFNWKLSQKDTVDLDSTFWYDILIGGALCFIFHCMKTHWSCWRYGSSVRESTCLANTTPWIRTQVLPKWGWGEVTYHWVQRMIAWSSTLELPTSLPFFSFLAPSLPPPNQWFHPLIVASWTNFIFGCKMGCFLFISYMRKLFSLQMNKQWLTC
jgi:hypothetical protein